MRIEPPPSLASASATMPAATAAAAPPLEPPVLCAGSHGLRAAPSASPSVEGSSPNSGVLVLPSTTRPAASLRSTKGSLRVAIRSRKSRDPCVQRTPSQSVRSFRR